jgi:hypothetical protein
MVHSAGHWITVLSLPANDSLEPRLQFQHNPAHGTSHRPADYYAEVLTENARSIWFIGVRTPWTLSRETVWNKTKRLAGKLFKAAGVLDMLGVAFLQYTIALILVPVILAAIYPLVYSYLEYQRELKSKNL